MNDYDSYSQYLWVYLSLQHYLPTPTLTCGITLCPNSICTVPWSCQDLKRWDSSALVDSPVVSSRIRAEPTSSNHENSGIKKNPKRTLPRLLKLCEGKKKMGSSGIYFSMTGREDLY